MTITPRPERRWTWVQARPEVPPKAVKDEVSAMAREIVETHLKPSYIEPPPKDPRWNYIVDIFTKWRGRYFYFMSRYACPGPNTNSPFFDTGFARLEYISDGSFSLAFMRHTGKWEGIWSDMTLDDALRSICSEPFFQP